MPGAGCKEHCRARRVQNAGGKVIGDTWLYFAQLHDIKIPSWNLEHMASLIGHKKYVTAL